MKSRTSSLLKLLLVIAICCSTIGIAHADNTIVKAYSGDSSLQDFFGTMWYPPSTVVGDLSEGGFDDTIDLFFEFTAPITDLQEMPGGCGDGCTNYFGNLDSGSVSFFGRDRSGQYPDYSFSGYILTGGTFFGQYGCPEPGMPCVFDSFVTFSFHSQSGSNGWYSTGNVNLSGGCEGGGCGNGGALSMITRVTPEPSSILFFGSGVFGLAGVLRRKFLS